VEHITAFVKNTSSGWPISRCVFRQQKTKQKSTSSTSTFYTFIFEEKKSLLFFTTEGRFRDLKLLTFFRSFPSSSATAVNREVIFFQDKSYSFLNPQNQATVNF
jgi:hypothetical protein